MSFDRLIDSIIQKKSPVVAGLDPKLDYIPSYIVEAAREQYGDTLDAAAEALYQFNVGLIDALCDVVPAVKPQCAYYELYGWQGVRALSKTIEYAKSKGLFVITDGKRNDIGSTMECYAKAHLGTVDVCGTQCVPFGGDALTVNGYLGSDGINPLLDICKKDDKGIFVLCKTSNPSSGELQDKNLGDAPLYAAMGDMCEQWGGEPGKYGYSCVGAVVGATYPEQLRELRERMKKTFFLVPGYGAQGGKAQDVALAFDKNGIGAIVNSSRAIMCAYKKEGCDERDYAAAARREAVRMAAELNEYIGK
ncbi:MAG: orotidine-5'-phosphate decarboxylase [Clostridia bacterium]|nr:orotidine-5'-phosphate decarboxylase [Clostridia bacterium]